MEVPSCTLSHIRKKLDLTKLGISKLNHAFFGDMFFSI